MVIHIVAVPGCQESTSRQWSTCYYHIFVSFLLQKLRKLACQGTLGFLAHPVRYCTMYNNLSCYYCVAVGIQYTGQEMWSWANHIWGPWHEEWIYPCSRHEVGWKTAGRPVRCCVGSRSFPAFYSQSDCWTYPIAGEHTEERTGMYCNCRLYSWWIWLHQFCFCDCLLLLFLSILVMLMYAWTAWCTGLVKKRNPLKTCIYFHL